MKRQVNDIMPEFEYNKDQIFNNRILWNVDDLMRVTGLSRQSIYNMAHKNKIPHRKKWGKLYFVPDEIINMIEEGE